MIKMSDLQYYLSVRMPGIGSRWMESEVLSAREAYDGWLTLRDYQFREEDVVIKRARGVNGNHMEIVSKKDLSRIVQRCSA